MPSGPPRITVFERPKGAICYEATFLRSYISESGGERPRFAAFPRRLKYYLPTASAAKRARIQELSEKAWENSADLVKLEHVCRTLVQDELDWWWESCSISDGHGFRVAPARQWTKLSGDSLPLLIGDIAEFSFRIVSGRRIGLIGLDNAGSSAAIDATWLKRQVHDFCAGQTAAVRVVIENPGDTLEDFVFTSHTPPPPVKELLSSIGVNENAKLIRRGTPAFVPCDWKSYTIVDDICGTIQKRFVWRSATTRFDA